MDESQRLAVIGVLGVVLGAGATLIGKMIFHSFTQLPHSSVRGKRNGILLSMLEDDNHPDHWRKLSTLSAVIGATPDETTRLLIDINARGSEKADGKWGLIKYHPLNEIGK